MLNVNTIEFKGQKAVINSYRINEFPVLAESCERQRQLFAARFPNAIVKTERMTESETRELVAEGGKTTEDRSALVWAIGKASDREV